MREKIERIAKGEIEFSKAQLLLSEESITLNVEAGRMREGSLHIRNSMGKKMKGVIYSSNRLLELGSNSFCDTEHTLNYRLDGSKLVVGEQISFEVTIVSECGEVSIPVYISVEAPYYTTAVGDVKDLEQFTDLARMDWTEAKKVFRSEEFDSVVLNNNTTYISIYQNLKKSISTSQAIEEFLITLNQKSKIELTIDKTHIEYSVDDESMDKLILRKNGWGYGEIRLSTDAPFIQLEQKYLWADRFIGDTYQISYLILAEKLRPGTNYGRIYVKTVYQTIVVDIVCKRRNEKNCEQGIGVNKYIDYALSKNYLSFRMDQKTLAQYVAGMDEIIQRVAAKNDNLYIELIRIHQALLTEEINAVEVLLDTILDDIIRKQKEEPILYCSYLYLNALYHRDDETIETTTEILRQYYKQSGNWRILWFLLFIDRRYERNRVLKISDIRELFNNGCHSPILYFEALKILQEEPYLLRELTAFELQIIHFGQKNGIVTKEIVLQYAYLAGKQKNHNSLLLSSLCQLYQSYGYTELLSAICCLLIRGMMKSSKYHPWYRLAVELQLHITELYEYYMNSKDEDLSEPLPESVLHYFVYNSSLSDRKRAYLYTSVITHKDKMQNIYRSYAKHMEIFALKQLEAGNINGHLAILYREFMEEGSIRAQVYEFLPRVMFYHEFLCSNPNIVAVTVVTRETGEELTVPVVEGKAYLKIYSSNCDIFPVDANGNRYYVTMPYELIHLMPLTLDQCIQMNYQSNRGLQLYLYDVYCQKQQLDDKGIEISKLFLMNQQLSKDYYHQCLTQLIDYYDQYHEEYLEQYLSQVNLNHIKVEEQMRFFGYYLRYGNYRMAFALLSIYGYHRISTDQLLMLCSSYLEHPVAGINESLLLEVGAYMVALGVYDERIICHLLNHYYGPTKTLARIWEVAKQWNLNSTQVEEKIFHHIIFAELGNMESSSMFLSYYDNHPSKLLLRAYLNYRSYEYLLYDAAMEESTNLIIQKELDKEENDICLLGWLKYNGKKRNWTEEEISLAQLSLLKFYQQGIILPFFQDYQSMGLYHDVMTNRYFIQCIADPKKDIYLHYRIHRGDESTEYVVEPLRNTFYGIHSKNFILFYGEKMEYYITEEVDGEWRTISQGELVANLGDTNTDSKLNKLNLMLLAKEMQDEDTLIQLMREYLDYEYIAIECFKPLT